MSFEEHKRIKMACAKLGLSTNEFLLRAAFEHIGVIEDEWLAKKARETQAKIGSGKEKTIRWDEMKKRIS